MRSSLLAEESEMPLLFRAKHRQLPQALVEVCVEVGLDIAGVGNDLAVGVDLERLQLLNEIADTGTSPRRFTVRPRPHAKFHDSLEQHIQRPFVANPREIVAKRMLACWLCGVERSDKLVTREVDSSKSGLASVENGVPW